MAVAQRVRSSEGREGAKSQRRAAGALGSRECGQHVVELGASANVNGQRYRGWGALCRHAPSKQELRNFERHQVCNLEREEVPCAIQEE